MPSKLTVELPGGFSSRCSYLTAIFTKVVDGARTVVSTKSGRLSRVINWPSTTSGSIRLRHRAREPRIYDEFRYRRRANHLNRFASPILGISLISKTL